MTVASDGDGPSQLHDIDGGPELAAIAADPPVSLVDPAEQAQIIFVGNVIIGVIVWASLRFGLFYDESREPPRLYTVLLVIAVAVYVFAHADAVAKGFAWALAPLLKDKDEVDNPAEQEHVAGATALVERFKHMRDRLWGAIVYLTTALTVGALCVLVAATGLGIESPFIPFVTAPAVFGPFIAKTPSRVIALAAATTIVLAMLAWLAPDSVCGVDKCVDDAQAHALEPSPALFVVTTSVTLLAAGYVAGRRLKNETKIRESYRRLRAEVEASAS